jgi:hypothetical protein
MDGKKANIARVRPMMMDNFSGHSRGKNPVRKTCRKRDMTTATKSQNLMVKLIATAMVDVEGGDEERRSSLCYVSSRLVLRVAM